MRSECHRRGHADVWGRGALGLDLSHEKSIDLAVIFIDINTDLKITIADGHGNTKTVDYKQYVTNQ